MALDFASFINVAEHVLNTGRPLMLRGRHGIGKSELVYQIAASRGLPVVERRISQMSEGDLIGLPVVNGDSTAWNPPDWFKTAMNKPVVLFLDEVDRGSLEVRQGVFQLTDSHALNGHKLHKDTLIIAACNGGVHGAQYQVADLDPAELDRWTVFDVEPTSEDWLKYAKGKVHQIVWEFINDNKLHLEHKGEFEPNKKYPSRRSWFRFNAAVAKMLDSNEIGEDLLVLMYQLATGFVGFEAAVKFKDFVKNYERQVSVEDLLDKCDMNKFAKWGVSEHCSYIQKLATSPRLAKELSTKEMTNVATYFVSLPSEAAMKLFDTLNECYQNPAPMNGINLSKAKTIDGKTTGGKFASMFAGKSV